MDESYLPASPPARLTAYEFHVIAASRAVGTSLPNHVPMKKSPLYQTEYGVRVGRHVWEVQGSRDQQHCRINTDATAVPPVTYEAGSMRPPERPKTAESLARLESFRQLRSADREATQRRREASIASAARPPVVVDPVHDALAFVKNLRCERTARLEKQCHGIGCLVYDL